LIKLKKFGIDIASKISNWQAKSRQFVFIFSRALVVPVEYRLQDTHS
jgi:hypothetical protein